MATALAVSRAEFAESVRKPPAKWSNRPTRSRISETRFVASAFRKLKQWDLLLPPALGRYWRVAVNFPPCPPMLAVPFIELPETVAFQCEGKV